MKPIARSLIAIYQILGGTFALLILPGIVSFDGLGSFVVSSVLCLLCLLPLSAGIMLFARPAVGKALTLATQFSQLAAVVSPVLTYIVVTGVGIRISVGVQPPYVGIMDTRLLWGLHRRLGAELGLAVLRDIPELRGYQISINLVALGLLILILRKKKKETAEQMHAEATSKTAPSTASEASDA